MVNERSCTLNTKQLRRPFDVYYKNLGRFSPSSGAGPIVELLCKCGEHLVSTQELRQWRQVNRSSATKVMDKLCDAGVAQHTDSSHTKVEITERGRKVLVELEQAMRAAPEGRRPGKTSSKKQPTSELPPKRSPTSVPGRWRRHYDADQLPLDHLAADANGS